MKRNHFISILKNKIENGAIRVIVNLFFILPFLSFIVACSKVNFTKDTPQGCINTNNQCSYNYTIYGSGGMVDILFVNDNSGSMTFEQKNMGTHFPNLLQKLDERMLDYHIGITTTDISSKENTPREINLNGELQDGKLIEFKPGMKFLVPNTPLKESLFASTMQRQESLKCDQFIQNSIAQNISQTSTQYQIDYYKNCPSGDERGVYAALRAIYNNESQFIRPEAHLAIVFLTDEDNRSFGNTEPGSAYPLEKWDLPQTLIDYVSKKYSSTGKTLQVHSVVVPSGDTQCLNEQNNQLNNYIKGQEGKNYEYFSDLTQGYKGSVCKADWGTQMGEIGAAIVKQVKTFKLHCASPQNLEVTYTPSSAQNSFTMNGDTVIFSRPLDPSSQVHFKYSCL